MLSEKSGRDIPNVFGITSLSKIEWDLALPRGFLMQPGQKGFDWFTPGMPGGVYRKVCFHFDGHLHRKHWLQFSFSQMQIASRCAFQCNAQTLCRSIERHLGPVESGGVPVGGPKVRKLSEPVGPLHYAHITLNQRKTKQLLGSA